MKVVFAGPSLHGVTTLPKDVEIRPPAAHGDVLKAVEDGARVIGLIDGYFGWIASVWHKEILYALSLGVKVLGASSMGALRAAECAAYGMVPVGAIALAYCGGDLIDDDAVALTHLPAELGYAPTTEPLVDARATIEEMRRIAAIEDDVADELNRRASQLHFAARTVEAICDLAIISASRCLALRQLYEAHRISLKLQDALLLLETVAELPDRLAGSDPSWRFHESPSWRQVRSP